MNRDRRQTILWELVDTMFTKIEYWDEASKPLSNDEYEYLINVISKFAQSCNIHNHFMIK